MTEQNYTTKMQQISQLKCHRIITLQYRSEKNHRHATIKITNQSHRVKSQIPSSEITDTKNADENHKKKCTEQKATIKMPIKKLLFINIG